MPKPAPKAGENPGSAPPEEEAAEDETRARPKPSSCFMALLDDSSLVTLVGIAGSPLAPTSVHGPAVPALRNPYLATWLIVKPPPLQSTHAHAVQARHL